MPNSKFLLRDHSLPFNENRFSDSVEVRALLQHIWNSILELRRTRKSKIIDASKLMDHIEAIVLDIYVACETAPYIFRYLSMRASDYSYKESRYKLRHLSYRNTKNVLDDLQDLGLIEQFKGYKDKTTGVGYQTRICATGALVEMFVHFEINLDMIALRSAEVIWLRDREGNSVEYEDFDLTNIMRVNLNKINRALEDSKIRLSLSDAEIEQLHTRLARDYGRSPIDFQSVKLKRIFNNNSFCQGGRFYGGWWQGLPKEVRPYIYINHKNTIEIDYSGLHIRMLYGSVNIECPDDPYDLNDFPRDDQKIAVLTIINAEEKKKAIAALKRKCLKNVSRLCDALIERHSPISQYFFTGEGIGLQYKDSQVAELVMLKIIDLGGIALPVHDSFIVRVGREHELEQAMDEAFNEIYPNIPSKHKRKADLLEIENAGKSNSSEFDFVSSDISKWPKEEWDRLWRTSN